MRWPVVRVLIAKEFARLAGNRGAAVLAALLIVFALLLSLFAPGGQSEANPLAGVQQVFIDYWRDGPWVDHLRANPPPNFTGPVRFRHVSEIPTRADGILTYPHLTAAIQLRSESPDQCLVWFWYPGSDPTVLAELEAWFFAETGRFFRKNGGDAVPATGDVAELWLSQWDAARRSGADVPKLAIDRSALGGGHELRRTIAAALVLFGQFLFGVYLMSALACEERERGIWAAQRLTPARVEEMILAKAAVFPAAGFLLGMVLVAVTAPAVAMRPFTWAALAVSALGSFGLGLIVAALARTQRAASLGAMAYTLVVTLFLLICRQTGLKAVPYLFLEFHVPRLVEDVLAERAGLKAAGHAAAALVIAVILLAVANRLFRRVKD